MNCIRPFAASALFVVALLSACAQPQVGYISTIVEYEDVSK